MTITNVDRIRKVRMFRETVSPNKVLQMGGPRGRAYAIDGRIRCPVRRWLACVMMTAVKFRSGWSGDDGVVCVGWWPDGLAGNLAGKHFKGWLVGGCGFNGGVGGVVVRCVAEVVSARCVDQGGGVKMERKVMMGV
uniref:Uncharacterized protein n=1 Tax=Tanacetum cinerariifolium TaxID=118510 RepID=A0A6L2K8J3_TANCI|nr:hypothetical protein [Tanacetum cinerariifolium]